MQCVFSPEVSYNNGVFTAPAVGEASAEYRRGCDVLFFLGFSGYWPAGEAPGEGEERLVLDELAVEVAERHGVPVVAEGRDRRRLRPSLQRMPLRCARASLPLHAPLRADLSDHATGRASISSVDSCWSLCGSLPSCGPICHVACRLQAARMHCTASIEPVVP